MPGQILVIVGPTASGKTDVASRLAQKIQGEIVSCDSMQVYRDMPIITQSLSGLSAHVKTHLVSFLDPEVLYNASCYRKDAENIIESILKNARLPIVVGGTGLYLRALLDGLFGVDGRPVRDEVVRQKLAEEAKTSERGAMHARLKAVDPESAHKIHPNDLRRVIRALEVYQVTGRPLSIQKDCRDGIRSKHEIAIYSLNWDRTILYERINARVERMLDEGLVEEVAALSKRMLSQTAAMALGIREIQAYLDRKISLPDAIEELKKNTRNYAKRQIAWFKYEKGVESISCRVEDTPDTIADRILSHWRCRWDRGSA